MYPTQTRIKELRERFGVHNGQFFAYYMHKNLNWYYSKKPNLLLDQVEWFNFGDIRQADIPRLQALLKDEEVLILGWKDLPPDKRKDSFFGDGGGLILSFNSDLVLYDKRKSALHGQSDDDRHSSSG